MDLIINTRDFQLLSDSESFEISGGINWGAIADACGGIAVVCAFIAPACPPAAAVGLVSACFYVGYKVGQGLK